MGEIAFLFFGALLMLLMLTSAVAAPSLIIGPWLIKRSRREKLVIASASTFILALLILALGLKISFVEPVYNKTFGLLAYLSLCMLVSTRYKKPRTGFIIFAVLGIPILLCGAIASFIFTPSRVFTKETAPAILCMADTSDTIGGTMTLQLYQILPSFPFLKRPIDEPEQSSIFDNDNSCEYLLKEYAEQLNTLN